MEANGTEELKRGVGKIKTRRRQSESENEKNILSLSECSVVERETKEGEGLRKK